MFCTAKYRGGGRRTEGLIKQRGLEYKQKQQSPIPPLSGGEAARETRRREKGEECLSGASSADPDGDRSDKPKGPITAAAFLCSFFSLLRRMNKQSESRASETIFGGERKSSIQFSPPAVPRSIAGCFAQQNIGEVSHSDGGVEKTAAVTKSNLTLLPCRTP